MTDTKILYRDELTTILSTARLDDLDLPDYHDLDDVDGTVDSEHGGQFRTVEATEMEINTVSYGTIDEHNVLSVSVVTEAPDGTYWQWSWLRSLSSVHGDTGPERLGGGVVDLIEVTTR